MLTYCVSGVISGVAGALLAYVSVYLFEILCSWTGLLTCTLRACRLENYTRLMEMTWKNEQFISYWKSTHADAENHLRIVNDYTVNTADIHEAVHNANCILLWKQFVPEEVVKQFSNIGKDTFENKEYSFFFDGPATVEKDKFKRPFVKFYVHDAMDKMRSGSKLYLGFSTDFALHNRAIKDTLSTVLEKVNDHGNFYSARNAFTHSFLYWGNQFQAIQHQAVVPDFSIQLANSKLWRFVHPKYTPKMQAVRGDVPGVLLSKRVLVGGTGIPFTEVLVEPGDLLYFPEHWWHEVHNVEKEAYGLMIGFRDKSKKHFRRNMFSSIPMFFHKLTAFIDMTVNTMDASAPEMAGLDNNVGVCVAD